MTRDRLSNARRSQALDMQQSALLQLLLATLLFFVLGLAAAYFLVIPRGVRTPRAVAPVLAGFMQAGAAQDSLRGHALLSVRGLRTYSQADVAALFAQRTYFEGYAGLTVRSMRMLSTEAGSLEAADVVARVRYASAEPTTLQARMELEEGEWHIAKIEISRAGP